MSSGTKMSVGTVAGAMPSMKAAIEGDTAAGPTMQLTERQQELDRLWRYYRCANYDDRKVDWNGAPALPKLEHEAVASSGYLPPGFYDAGGQMGDIPLKFRKPTAPLYLGRVIVARFTSLLFSSKRHPRITSDDPRTEDWLTGFAEATRLWSMMSRARTYGGAMGSVAIGFKIVDGKPFVEVHDPRWCVADFDDRSELTVSKFEKRYQFPEEVTDRLTGERVTQWYWYRRVITKQSDIVWPKVLIEDNQEPIWEDEKFSQVDHKFGFCPIVWVQNTPMDDDMDGDPDCHGIFDTIEAIDMLWAQTCRGTIANCDPTLGITSDAEFSSVKKGTGNALQVEKGGSIQYLEIEGSGAEAAMKLADKLEEKATMVARCVLDVNFDGPARTEMETSTNYSNMIEQADELREQYGERGVKRLLEMVLTVAAMHQKTWIDWEGPVPQLVRGLIKLPKKRVVQEDGSVVWQERALGVGEQIDLHWPQYFTPSLDSVAKAVTASGEAKQYALIDEESATKFVAEYFQIEDIRGTIARAKAAQAAMADAFAEQATAVGGGGPPAPQTGKNPFG